MLWALEHCHTHTHTTCQINVALTWCTVCLKCHFVWLHNIICAKFNRKIETWSVFILPHLVLHASHSCWPLWSHSLKYREENKSRFYPLFRGRVDLGSKIWCWFWGRHLVALAACLCKWPMIVFERWLLSKTPELPTQTAKCDSFSNGALPQYCTHMSL